MSRYIDFLSDEQCESIVNTALNLLENTGADVNYEPARDVMQKAGCSVDGIRVRVPRQVVYDALETLPKTITLYNRFGEPAVELNAHNGKTHYGCPPDAIYRIDPYTGERRLAVLEDVAHTARVADNLENIDIVNDLAYPSDCPDEISTIMQLRTVLENTSKPCTMNTFSIESMDTQLEMLYAIAGSKEAYLEKPFVMGGLPAKPPLYHTDVNLKTLMHYNELGLPLFYKDSISLGASGPATIPGALACGLADYFVGLVISQGVRKGAPLIAGVFTDPEDFRTMYIAFSTPEFDKASCACASLFRYLGIPYICHMTATDSAVFDQQAAADITTGILTGEACGVNFNFFVGFLETAMSGCLEAVVFGNELISFARSFFNPFVVDEDTLAEDVITEVGPGGNFASEEHTLDHIEDCWVPINYTHDIYKRWENAGSKDLRQRLNENVRELIEKGPRHPLDPELVAKLDAIVEKAKGEFLNK